MNTFRSPAGRDEIRQACRNLYSRCPVPVESHFIDTGKFGRTHVLIAGNPSGPPLILLHGASNNAASWFDTFSIMAGDFRLYALDIPGQPGLSGEIRPHFTDGSMGEWFENSVHRLNLKQFHLCGRSMGGWISLEYGFRHPESILRMILLAPGGLAVFRKTFLFRVLPWIILGEKGLGKINRMIYGEVPVSPEFASFTLLMYRHFRPMFEKVPIFPDELLRNISFPLLYIGGKKDPLLKTCRSATRLRNLTPGAEITILKDTAHAIRGQESSMKKFLLGDKTGE
jgi:pimeloyl-ACP methyl ester carboxylesterase